jgi:hypothetical protein
VWIRWFLEWLVLVDGFFADFWDLFFEGYVASLRPGKTNTGILRFVQNDDVKQTTTRATTKANSYGMTKRERQQQLQRLAWGIYTFPSIAMRLRWMGTRSRVAGLGNAKAEADCDA